MEGYVKVVVDQLGASRRTATWVPDNGLFAPKTAPRVDLLIRKTLMQDKEEEFLFLSKVIHDFFGFA